MDLQRRGPFHRLAHAEQHLRRAQHWPHENPRVRARHVPEAQHWDEPGHDLGQGYEHGQLPALQHWLVLVLVPQPALAPRRERELQLKSGTPVQQHALANACHAAPAQVEARHELVVGPLGWG